MASYVVVQLIHARGWERGSCSRIPLLLPITGCSPVHPCLSYANELRTGHRTSDMASLGGGVSYFSAISCLKQSRILFIFFTSMTHCWTAPAQDCVLLIVEICEVPVSPFLQTDKIYVRQLHDPLVYLLLFPALCTFAEGTLYSMIQLT